MREFAGKRVLMLLENNPYLRDTRVKREARTLVKNGYSVTVISPKLKGESYIEHDEAGVRLYQFPIFGWGKGARGYIVEFSYALIMMSILSLWVLLRGGFDVLHAHCPPDTVFPLAIFYRLLGKKFVYDHHDLSPELYLVKFGKSEKSLVYKVLLFFEKITTRMANHVIATNESYKQVEMERDGIPEHRITIVRNGPNLDRVRESQKDQHLRQRASTILGFFGEMGPQDGVDYLLRSINKLVFELNKTDVHCVIVGRGDTLEGLESLSESLQIQQYVTFTGWVTDDEFFRYMSTIDIGLDPDPSNPFNDRCTMIKMMEYMALEIPVVAFDLPEHRVTAKDAALYAPPNNEFEFACRIAELIDDPSLRQEMGRKGRERIEAELAWSHQAKRLLEAYESMRKSEQDRVLHNV